MIAHRQKLAHGHPYRRPCVQLISSLIPSHSFSECDNGIKIVILIDCWTARSLRKWHTQLAAIFFIFVHKGWQCNSCNNDSIQLWPTSPGCHWYTGKFTILFLWGFEGFPELRQLSSPLTSVGGACTALSNRFIQSCDSDCLNILGLHHLLVKIDSGILQNCWLSTNSVKSISSVVVVEYSVVRLISISCILYSW